MPLRSEMMPANAPSEIGAASDNVPPRTPVRFAGFPTSNAASAVTTQNGSTIASDRRQRNDAPRTSWRIPVTPVTTPVRIHSRPTVVEIVMLDPPCLSTQKENTAGVSSEVTANWRATTPRAAKMTPRMRAARSALRSEALTSTVTCSKVGVAAVMPRPLPPVPGRRPACACDRTGRGPG